MSKRQERDREGEIEREKEKASARAGVQICKERGKERTCEHVRDRET